AQTDQKVRAALGSARGLLEKGWQTADLAKLTEARGEATRAVDIARSGGGRGAVLGGAEAILGEALGRLDRANNDRALLVAMLDVATPQEFSAYSQPSVDEQYATAFRRWGLDVDRASEAEVVARLGQAPDVVVQELIARLDSWMVERRRQKHPESEWRRLFRVADRLHRRGPPPRVGGPAGRGLAPPPAGPARACVGG